MAFQKGDFLLVDYVMKVKDTNEVVDLTVEEIAKKEKVYREDGIYEPALVILGEGLIIKGVEEELYKMDVGESRIVEVPPDKAFGERDPNKVKIVNARELAKRGIAPKLGARVETEDGLAIVRRAEGGRVVLDFNHPLAGRTIVCELKVVKKVDETKEKVKELIHARIKRIDKEKFKVEFPEPGTLIIEVPPEAYTYDGLQYAKRGIALDVARYLKDINTVKFVEAYTLQQEKTERIEEKDDSKEREVASSR
ncbi:MAG: FKBP-type peptidyl-prolyl cis-trans isomerase [Candidatus Nezhaarchaeota archaeon]|nr:FKBP-type peptidyl-prolyl cis-trans isomerase [Candidatus Nezhaarchaeota archaeon]